MADINAIQTEIAQDEVAHAISIMKKDGSPYLARDGKTPCTIDVLGSDAHPVKLARDSATRRLLRGRRIKMEPADLRANRVAIAVSAITGWSGWDAGDTGFPFTPENAILMLGADHILEQVEAGITDHSDFS